MLKRVLASGVINLLLAGPAFAYYADYLPAQVQAKAQTVEQRTVAYEFAENWTAEVLKGVTATNKNHQLTLSGVDKQGHPWTNVEDTPFGGSCYVADVDKNGTEDIIFWLGTGSGGYAFSVLVIEFLDKNGVPHREEAVGRFSSSSLPHPENSGVKDILIAPDRKGSLVLVQDLAYGSFDGRDMGYWRWSVLRAHDCQLTEMNSAFGIHFPCYVFFANKPNHLLSRHGAALERDFQAAQKQN